MISYEEFCALKPGDHILICDDISHTFIDPFGRMRQLENQVVTVLGWECENETILIEEDTVIATEDRYMNYSVYAGKHWSWYQNMIESVVSVKPEDIEVIDLGEVFV